MNYKDLLGKVAHQQFVYGPDVDFMKSFRMNQILSKEWLVDNIQKSVSVDSYKNVAVLGSWSSVLLYELMSAGGDVPVEHWHFFDIDRRVHRQRDCYFKANNMERNYTSYTKDVDVLFMDAGFHKQFDLIINPSCEHMMDLRTTNGPIYALCSNDMDNIPDQHINCVQSSQELREKNDLQTVFYKGTKRLPSGFNRFCVIGLH
jgi:hypothetical protein